MSQNATIEKILERNGKIDNYWCIQTRLTLRLAARINDLKKVGWQFFTEIHGDGNCVYIVKGAPPAKQLTLESA